MFLKPIKKLKNIPIFFSRDQNESSNHSEPKNSKIEQETIEEPSGNEKILIDKLAEYVGRNGPEFEDNLHKKNDSRFDFLNPDHRFYKYYINQKDNILKKVFILNLKKKFNNNLF